MTRMAAALLLLAPVLWAAPEIGYGRGQVHHDFRLPKIDGGFGRLSDFRGKRVLLFNFASW